MKEESLKWGIIGGGMMGMTIALRLAQKGFKVTILESSVKPGGLAGATDMGGLVWDKFYHVILMSDLHTRKIIGEIGLENELRWVETRTGFYSGSKLYSLSSVIDFLKFPPINIFGIFRLGLTIIAASLIKDGRRMEKIPVERWLKRWSGKQVFQKIWLPLLKAKLGDNYRETSALFIWTTIQRMYAARRTGLKKEMFGYVSGGYNRIISAFEEKLRSSGVEIITGSNVKKVMPARGNQVIVKTEGENELLFDRVISTLPSDISVQIAPTLSNEESLKHRRIRYMGVVSPSVLLKKPVSGFYVTNIIDTWPPFTGIIEMTALIDPSETGGRSLVYLPKYVEADNELFNRSGSELREYFLGALFKMYPALSEEDVIHWTIASARRVFALPTLSYSENLPSVRTSLNGYFIINSAQITDGTLNVNETVKVAEAKLEEILKP
jgi:protoporphyrinogen oxidase